MTTNLTTYEHDIFLSYNKADEEWTGKLAARLEQEDWQGRKLKVFFAPWDIRPGQSIPLEIERALPKRRKVGIVWSPEAAASVWVELERLVITHIAVSAREERLIPLLRRRCDFPALLQHILNIDFMDDSGFESSYKTLIAVIKDEPLPRGQRQPRLNSLTALPGGGDNSGEDPNILRLRSKLRTLQQLQQENLIDENIMQTYQRRMLDEWLGKG